MDELRGPRGRARKERARLGGRKGTSGDTRARL